MFNKFTGATPILRVDNLDHSMGYYVNKLGFTERWRWPQFACVSRGDASIFLCQGGQGRPGMWISVFMKDVMPLYEEYTKTGALIVEPPMNFPWGHCEFLVQDPDGHMLRMTGNKTGDDSEGHDKTLRSQAT